MNILRNLNLGRGRGLANLSNSTDEKTHRLTAPTGEPVSTSMVVLRLLGRSCAGGWVADWVAGWVAGGWPAGGWPAGWLTGG